MKLVQWIALILALVLLPAGALAAGSQQGLSAQESYDRALEDFTAGEYATAAEKFTNAGNYLDAKKWAYYCLAINAVVHNGSDAAAMADAAYRFELLSAQEFEQAGQWATYCSARSRELSGFRQDAASLYQSILVYNSIERYLTCKGSSYSDLHQNADDVRRRLGRVAGTPASLYEEALELYRFDLYADAADYFCLAGNYSDARQWYYYCTAIKLVTGGDLDRANVLFALLSAHDFADSADWLIYCRGREAEASGFIAEAVREYQKIFLHDSSDRYVNLQKQLNRNR